MDREEKGYKYNNGTGYQNCTRLPGKVQRKMEAKGGMNGCLRRGRCSNQKKGHSQGKFKLQRIRRENTKEYVINSYFAYNLQRKVTQFTKKADT